MVLYAIAAMFGLMIVPTAHSFFPKMFYTKKNMGSFFVVALALAVIGLTTQIGADPTKPNFLLLLISPLFSLLLLKGQLYLFRKALKRDPTDPAKNYSLTPDGLGWDRFFHISFNIISYCVPVLSITYPYGW